jgi:DNA-3-methyladenine glycosylase II
VPDEYPSWGKAAYRHLLNADAPMAALVKKQGPVLRPTSKQYFARLVRAIVGQQISTTAATSIYNRFVALMGKGRKLTPRSVLRLSEEEIRGSGFSGAKLASVRDLAQRAVDGRLDLTHLESLPDEEIIEQLVAVRGIGRWTAEMFLMFSLGRPDVLAADDLGVQVGIQRLYALDGRPTPSQVKQLAQDGRWHPYATEACLQLWESLRNNPQL